MFYANRFAYGNRYVLDVQEKGFQAKIKVSRDTNDTNNHVWSQSIMNFSLLIMQIF